MTSLSPEQRALVRTLFGRALDLDAPARDALLIGSGADADVRAEVASLLVSHDAAGSFIETPADLPVSTNDESLGGTQIGSYRIERALGQGGMGTVYLAARSDEAYRKHVALKIIKRGMDTGEIVARFRRERQTLANLDHPNIARLLDAGSTGDGRPFFVMEYVDGQPLDDYCRNHLKALPARLRLFRTICAAVQFAHVSLVVHRDLKPDNILVTADGVPKLLDFGIAKLLGPPEGTLTVAETRPAARLMTLDYASPEQLRGGPISTATDVFSLGVMLYEIAAGAHPFRRAGRTPAGVETAICDEDPPRPGAGEIDLIVMKAIRKEPGRRYQSAIELDEDLRRHLAGLPITAHADTLRYRASKFVRRHAGAVTATAAVSLATLAALLGMTWQARVAQEERDRARVEAVKAQQVSAVLEQMLRAADPSVDGRAVTVAAVLAEASRRAGVELAAQPDVRAAVRSAIGNTYYSLALYPEAEAELTEAITLREGLHGPESAETADARTRMAYVKFTTGDLGAAAEGFAAALRSLDLAEDPGALAVRDVRWRALNGLGLVAGRRGESAEAEARYGEALAIATALYGDTDQRIAEITNNLAVQAQARGDLPGAERLYREALRVMHAVEGEALPGYAAGLSNLAGVLHSRGQFAEARGLYEQALARRIELLGPDSPDVAFTEFNLSDLLRETGEFERALTLTDRILARRGAGFPDQHPIVAAALLSRGRIRLALNDGARAERDIREALRLRTAALPQGHWLIANTRSVLGECVLANGRLDEAGTLLLESYERLLADRGPVHERTKEAGARLARFYDATGQTALAARLR